MLTSWSKEQQSLELKVKSTNTDREGWLFWFFFFLLKSCARLFAVFWTWFDCDTLKISNPLWLTGPRSGRSNAGRATHHHRVPAQPPVQHSAGYTVRQAALVQVEVPLSAPTYNFNTWTQLHPQRKGPRADPKPSGRAGRKRVRVESESTIAHRPSNLAQHQIVITWAPLLL